MREQVQFGAYPVVAKLGEGATSRVYRGRDPSRARDVAIKLFLFDPADGEPAARVRRKLFLAEASLAGRLRHPGIVAVLDAAEWTDHAYVVMEYVEGTTLERHAGVGTLLPPLRVLEIAARCAAALDYSARQGIVHRDIKPANLLLSRAGEPKVGDFGASLQQRPGWATTQVSAIGSPAYMSPEQVRMEPLTHQTDIYSLGATLYRLLTGRTPFAAASPSALAYAILNAAPRPPSAWRPGLPPSVDAFVLKALEKEPRERHLTWQEFIDDLALATRALSRCPLSLASSVV
ncbi:MAG: serine/threonine-protein kinase [Burkholderiales bacterium]